MNDPRKHEDRLIADAFHDDWDQGASAQFARMAAASARKRRLTRQALIASTTSVALFAIAVVALHSRLRPELPNPSHSPRQSNITRGYEVISDAELLTELRDRSLVMVRQRNGTNEFVLIGQ